MLKNKFTTTAIIIISIALIWSCFNLKLWNNKDPIKNDVFSYYIYLPAYFIENDLRLTFHGKEDKKQYDHLWYLYAPNGYKITKMGIGISYLYAPFFCLGHFVSPLMGYPSDGFSKPYVIALVLGAILYGILGLYFTARILLSYFSDVVTGLTILLTGLATNFLCYTTLDPLMPHVFNFFLISLFIYLSVRWHNNPTLISSAILGLIYGIIIVARPTNAIVILFPLLLNVTSKNRIVEKFHFLKNNWYHILFAMVLCLIAIIPQLLYWKHITGDYVYYSYNEEGFYFNNPKIIQGLFGFRKGWLIYTPVMAFALIGIYFIYKNHRQYFWSISIFTLFNIYIIYSWWCWWYGGGFSSRPMIDSYSILAIPLAASINYFLKKKIISKIIVALFALFFIGLNAFQTYQFKSSLLHYDSMTKEAYFAIFGKLHFPENYSKLIKTPDYENAMRRDKEYNNE